MPIHKSCIPPIKNMIQAVLGQPETGSPNARVLIMINTISAAATSENRMPKTEARTRGAVEKAIIPSREYLNSFQKLHFVSPATLSTFSYSSHFVSKPIQPNIPYENLLYSGIDKIASFISFVIRR